MAIRYAEGDIFAARSSVMLHGCNSLGRMGKGFADVLKRKHPEAYDAYRDAFETTGLILGSVIWAQSGERVIGNCITQPTIGNDGRLHLSYDALRGCLGQVNLAAREGIPGTRFADGFDTVWMPMIGADLGGGDWRTISRIIEEELVDATPVVHFLPKDRARVFESSPAR